MRRKVRKVLRNRRDDGMESGEMKSKVNPSEWERHAESHSYAHIDVKFIVHWIGIRWLSYDKFIWCRLKSKVPLNGRHSDTWVSARLLIAVYWIIRVHPEKSYLMPQKELTMSDVCGETPFSLKLQVLKPLLTLPYY